GKYAIVNPNNHANMSQSSNDVIPTATRISALYALAELLPSLEKLEKALEMKAYAFSKMVKAGRTHYQDAVPITLGQEFSAYANRIRGARKRIADASEELKYLGIGGTAIGTGINTHPEFSALVVKKLDAETGFGLKIAVDKIDKTQNFDDFVSVSNSLRTLCVDLLKISNDLKLLNSGPNAGIAEIVLPEVEPGSSIMPGKVNPSIPECVDMVCFQVIGRDQAVVLGAANGVLELNVYTPLIMYDLLDSVSILKNAIEMFSDLCIEGIKPNEKKMNEYLENGLIIGTALNPVFGYEKVAEWVKEAQKSGKTLKQVIIEKKIMSGKDLENALDPKGLTKPNLR
ncbi:MAG: lyase family protein, partial [Candidatus Micrarchaeia archaeon]